MKLKDLREALGISQLELDRRAGLTQGTVRDIENERNANPTINVCVRIADALRRAGAKGVEIESLFGKVA